MSEALNINSQYFDSEYKHTWKRTIPPGLTEAETDMICEAGGLTRQSSALDLMCGYGRHALELARRDIPVTAIDNLKDYIEEINQASQEQALPVKTLVSDVTSIDLPGQFDAAICMGNSFAFFDRLQASKLVANVSKHLKANGIFIINSWAIAEIAIRYFKERDWHWAGEYQCVLESKYHFQPSRIETRQTVLKDNQVVAILDGIDYIFSLDEIEAMLEETGMKITSLYSTPRKKKFALGDPRIYIIATKFN